MIKNALLAFWLMVLAFGAIAQQKEPLTHDVYDKWENISGIEIAPDGEYMLYELNPQRQDGNLIVRSLDDNGELRIPRGNKAAFSPDGGFAVFHIEPPRDVVRQAKVDKKKREEMPKDSLGIFLLNQNDIIKYENVNSYQLPKEPSPWLAFTIDLEREVVEAVNEDGSAPADTIPPAPEKEEAEEKEEPETEIIKQLIIKNPSAGILHQFEEVEHYRMAENGNAVIFLQEPSENEDDILKIKKLYYFNTSVQSLHLLDSAAGDYKQLNLSKNGEHFSWLFSADTTEVKVYDLFVHQTGRRAATQSVGMETENMPEGFAVSEYQRPEFSDDNSKVFLGIAPKPEQEPEDTLLDVEKYSLDLWHWQDPVLQTQQKANAKSEKEKNYEAVLHLPTARLVPLADEEVHSISKDRYSNAEKVMGVSNKDYRIESSWLGGTPRDIYVVDVNDGSRKKIVERALSSAAISVSGDYIVYYDPLEEAWYSYSVEDDATVNLTAGLDVHFFDEDNDVPRFAWPYGIAGWGEDDEFLLIYDRYDIWKIDPSGKKNAVNITNGYGRDNDIRFRYENLDRDVYHIEEGKIWLSAFRETDKKDGYYTLDLRNGQLERMTLQDASFMQLQTAKNNDVFLWRRSTFNEYPDIWVSNGQLDNPRKISSANPFQSDYLWGTVQLVEWQDFANETLQGLLYLPEDFDPEKKYPMIVYFYERSSHNLHRHYVPSPSRSIINPSYCTSNGYVVFVPDITYREGFPGQSAYNAIVSGTQSLLERYPFINRDRMALQGQSWGGYQIAYLVTKTNMFRAAMAGAPVSNMVSAYGGIRWESGMVRQFQYEQTQSRIGGTLWEKPFHYIENSPVFFVPDIQTPLLIMHNDDDGAVPWYQGIELFVAMRRLSKPAWMLVYNKEAHNLRQWPARMDLSVRMYQFFDHYLKDKPAPRWMEEGIPYIEKNKMDGYELTE